MKHPNQKILYIIVLIATMTVACEDSWLDKKPEKSMVDPQSVEDYQAILDNSGVFNRSYLSMQESSADNYYITDENFSSLTQQYRSSYLWNLDGHFGEEGSAEWNSTYSRILHANIVLDGLTGLPRTPSNQQRWDEAKGAAYFFRAFNYYTLAQVFMPPFTTERQAELPGLFIKETAVIQDQAVLSNMAAAYDFIITDLKNAARLLPESTQYKTRPNRQAALALLSRIYLSTDDYQAAYAYADSSLAISGALLDYNDLDLNAPYKIPLMNAEVIFQASMSITNLTIQASMFVDSLLYASYDLGDLRREVFFNSSGDNVLFTGNYNNSDQSLFSGFTTAELYLTRSECAVRLGNIPQALSDINTLLEARSHRDRFTPLMMAGEEEELLEKILLERRKELAFRGVRFMDIRRLCDDGHFAVPLVRNVEAKKYHRSPSEMAEFAYPIPADEQQFHNSNN